MLTPNFDNIETASRQNTRKVKLVVVIGPAICPATFKSVSCRAPSVREYCTESSDKNNEIQTFPRTIHKQNSEVTPSTELTEYVLYKYTKVL